MSNNQTISESAQGASNGVRRLHTIDAKGQKLGRVASQAAHILMGKNSVSFTKHKIADVTVTIVNAAKLAIPEKKLKEKEYARFSGHVGGLRFETLRALIAKHGYRSALSEAIEGMIPRNKLRPEIMKRLTITD